MLKENYRSSLVIASAIRQAAIRQDINKDHEQCLEAYDELLY